MDSILAVQIFDRKRFKKKNQGFLGVINVRIGDIVELGRAREDGKKPSPSSCDALANSYARNIEQGP